MDDETDPLVVVSSAGAARWTLHPPVDPWADGYVTDLDIEISDDGLSASGSANLQSGTPESLTGFLVGLERDWRGWAGSRTWTALENGMSLEATHTGHSVVLAVTLRRPLNTWGPDAWSATVVLTLEPGEQLSRLARDAERFLSP